MFNFGIVRVETYPSTVEDYGYTGVTLQCTAEVLPINRAGDLETFLCDKAECQTCEELSVRWA